MTKKRSIKKIKAIKCFKIGLRRNLNLLVNQQMLQLFICKSKRADFGSFRLYGGTVSYVDIEG
ncbi:MAG TPA: hypothetical protein DEQ87_10990 [Algoriphagus sp.]|nr:hypothetical protein [Algoriphagus sp.]MAN87076.1 hypothetical protein [Algoriphagus sp.]HAD53398.1 hypothetical protein [Algoriphagus sp.]HAS57551.1 hypothetical protein [Algoriphagus sp.]HAZ23896.1 hypothetical protein [Algoriphagus sp.]